MASTHAYTFAELSTAGTEINELLIKIAAAGYTNGFIEATYNAGSPEREITVDEVVDKATLLSAIEAETLASLSVDTSALSISGDGVATGTITVTDSRGASASGLTVKVRCPPFPIVIDTSSITLDGSGQGTVTFGPTPAANMCCRPFNIEFYYDSGDALPVIASVQFT